MISLDQVLVLEQKVESAVKKITQLQAENDALRKKCAELTNSLSSKSEQLSSFEQDQGLIESKIVNLINRFNNIENSVLDAIGKPTDGTLPHQGEQSPAQQATAENGAYQAASSAPIAPEQEQVAPATAYEEPTSTGQNTNDAAQAFEQELVNEAPQNDAFAQNDQSQPSFFDMQQVPGNAELQNSQAPSQDNTQFDIF